MRDRRWMLGLFGLALALRVAWVLAVDRQGLPVNDVLFYHLSASSLADGDGYVWFGEPTSRWPPVYPALLALVYALLGAETTVGELLNAVVGALAAPLTYLCALRLHGRGAVAATAGLLVAVMPGQWLFADVLLAETLYTTLLVAVIALTLALPRERWWAALSVGLAVGVAAETRGEGMLLALVPLAAWWRPSTRQLALLAAGVLVVVGGWTARNAIVMDAFVPVSTNGAQTLWSGHNPDAYGGPTYSFDREDVRAVRRAESLDGSARERELADSRRLRREAIEWALAHPLEELTLIPRRLAWLLRGDSTILFQWVATAGPGEPPALSSNVAVVVGNVADLFLYGLLTLTLLAALAAWRARPLASGPRALWLLLGASLVLYCVVLYGNYRYRVPLEPVMALLAAPLLARSILPATWTSAPSQSA